MKVVLNLDCDNNFIYDYEDLADALVTFEEGLGDGANLEVNINASIAICEDEEEG